MDSQRTNSPLAQSQFPSEMMRNIFPNCDVAGVLLLLVVGGVPTRAETAPRRRLHTVCNVGRRRTQRVNSRYQIKIDPKSHVLEFFGGRRKPRRCFKGHFLAAFGANVFEK